MTAIATKIEPMDITQLIAVTSADLEVESIGGPTNDNEEEPSTSHQTSVTPMKFKQESMDENYSSASSSVTGLPATPGNVSFKNLAVTSLGSFSSPPPSLGYSSPAVTMSGTISQAGRKKSNPVIFF